MTTKVSTLAEELQVDNIKEQVVSYYPEEMQEEMMDKMPSSTAILYSAMGLTLFLLLALLAYIVCSLE